MFTPRKITLTDTQWMDLIDGDREGLPRCCANVSTLRDDLILIARNGGDVPPGTSLGMHLEWVFPDHDMSPAIETVVRQMGMSLSGHGHDPAPLEL